MKGIYLLAHFSNSHFANFVSVHFKKLWPHFYDKENGVYFFNPRVGDLPKIKECYIWQEWAKYIPNLNFIVSLKVS